jgi:hypothetical protein
VRYQGDYWQIDRRHVGLSLVGQRVVVRTLLDGRRQLLYRGQKLVSRQLPTRPQPPAPNNHGNVKQHAAERGHF